MGTLTAGTVPTPPPPEPAHVAWFDFVLQPSRLEEHLNAIAGGAVDAPRPTALELTNLFLEKAVEKGGAALLGAATEAERRHNSHDCSSAMSARASSKVLPETHLLTQRQHRLLRLAARVAPAAQLTTLAEIEDKVAVRFQRPLLVALLMHCERQLALQCKCDLYRWHLRRSLPGASEKHAATVVAPEMVAAADDWLRQFLHETRDVAFGDCGMAAARLGEGEMQELREEAAHCPPRQRCALCYDVGEFLFAQGDLPWAKQYLERASWLMTEHESECGGALPLDRLQGFLTACSMMAPAERATGPGDAGEGEPLVLACERARRARDEAALLACVREDRARRELPEGYRRALEEDGALSLATRARVAAANVAHEVMGGGPPEVALRLMPYVRARDGVPEACSRMAYFVDTATALGSEGEVGQEQITKCIELMSSDFPQATARQLASVQGLILEAANKGCPEQSVQAHPSNSEMNFEDAEELVGVICDQESPDYRLAVWLSQREPGPASSASRQPPPSAEHVKSGGPVAKRKRLEDQHESAPDAPLSKRLAVGESVGVGSANSSGRRTAPAPNGSPPGEGVAEVASAVHILHQTMVGGQGSLPCDTWPRAHLVARALGRTLSWPGAAAEALPSLANQIRTRDPPLPPSHAAMVQMALRVARCASACSAFYAPDGACVYGAPVPSVAPPECKELFHLLFPEASTKPKVESAAAPASHPAASDPLAEPKEAIANREKDPDCAAEAEQASEEPNPKLRTALERLTEHIRNPRVLRVVAASVVGCLARTASSPILRLEPYGALAFVVAGREVPPCWLKSPPSSPRCDLGAKLVGEAVGMDTTEPAGAAGDAASAARARERLHPYRLVQAVLLQLVREQGHNPAPESLLALAELAQVEGARGDAGFGSASALRYALRAAAACSRFFAVQEACLPEALFPAPVIRQMMTAASELNLALPAVVLSQFLPTPDYAAAFAILKATPTGQLDASYFEFLWQMPLLELLTHLYSVTNNKAQVVTLLALVQRPALCVHNPPNVQNSAIAALKQRFLQQLSSQILGCM